MLFCWWKNVYNFAGAVAVNSGYFTPSTGPIHLSEVQCSGNENDILQCNTSVIGDHNCTHNLDVGIVCEGVFTNRNM